MLLAGEESVDIEMDDKESFARVEVLRMKEVVWHVDFPITQRPSKSTWSGWGRGSSARG